MTQRSEIPKFGNWDSEENVPYTSYFDNARNSKGGGRMNPNDPQDNKPPVEASSSQQEAELKGQTGQATSATIIKNRLPEHSKEERRTSREDGDQVRRRTDSPLHHDATGQRSTTDTPLQRHDGLSVRSGSSKAELEGAKGSDAAARPRHETVGRSSPHRHGGTSASETPKWVGRHSAGSDRSVDHSPLHPQHHARVGGKVGGVSSPSWERKGSSEVSHGVGSSTPGRSRLRSVTRGDDSPDHSPTVPKFGAWDESDPASAEGFTQMFNQVREEKQSGGAFSSNKSRADEKTSNSSSQKQSSGSKGCWCFPWCRK